jgi:histone deacetylase 11
MSRVVYHRRYNIGFYGLERLHPFDSRKYGRAWRMLRHRFGSRLRALRVRPKRAASADELRLVHTQAYLDQLGDARYVADALELPVLRRLPGWMIDWHVLRPMRWATMGTILAARESLRHGLAINLGGGFHHARPAGGEGFCIYSDIGIAVASLRADGLLDASSRVAYIDTDAHQGNGVCHVFRDDASVFLFDIFNSRIYPCHDIEARQRIDCTVPITSACTEAEYLRALRDRLPGFLDSVGKSPVGLAIYNAGTDVLSGDPLGGLCISAAAILERDLFVVGELRRRGIPTVLVTSGGYTRQSFQVIADSVGRLLETHE